MATALKNLTEKDLKSSDSSDALLATDYTVNKKMKGIKFTVFLAFLISLVALAGAAFSFLTLQQEKAERSTLESSQVQMQAQSEALSEQVEQYQVVIGRLREQIENFIEERKDFKKEFDRNKIEVANLEKKLQALEDSGRQLPSSAISASSPATTTSLSPSDTPVVNSPAAGAEPQVLTVNKKFNFVVVNLGQRDGVKIGDELAIYRDENVIGRVQVEKLYDNFSAATILEEASNDEIQTSDVVREA